LEDAPPPVAKRASLLEPFSGRGAILVEIEPDNECQVQQTPSGVRLGLEYARREPDLQIGIITPYRAQCRLIQSKLNAECKETSILDRITVGTVHTFQGSERDIIIWDVLEMRNFNIGRLYRGDDGDRLSNVAITRARGKLILICDPEAFISAPGHLSVRQMRGIISRSFGSTRISLKALERKFLKDAGSGLNIQQS